MGGAAVISTMTGIPLATACCCCLAASVLNPRACFSAGVLPAYPAFFFVFTSFIIDALRIPVALVVRVVDLRRLPLAILVVIPVVELRRARVVDLLAHVPVLRLLVLRVIDHRLVHPVGWLGIARIIQGLRRELPVFVKASSSLALLVQE